MLYEVITVLGVLFDRCQIAPGSVTGDGLDLGGLLLAQGGKEGVQGAFAATILVPDDLADFDVDHVGHVFVPLLPSNLIDADLRGSRDRGKFFPGEFFQNTAVDAIDRFIIEAQKPARFGVRRNGGQAVNLFGETARKAAS